MKECSDPVGPENNSIIQESLMLASEVICAWGNHGAHLNRSESVLKIIQSTETPLFHLGLTKKNQPIHPLYLGYNRQLIKWEKK